MEPVLAPGQLLNGFVFQKMIGAKAVYVRPSKEILAPESLAIQWVWTQILRLHYMKKKVEITNFELFIDFY